MAILEGNRFWASECFMAQLKPSMNALGLEVRHDSEAEKVAAFERGLVRRELARYEREAGSVRFRLGAESSKGRALEVRIPGSLRRARRRQSRLSVLTLSPKRVGIRDGATTVHGIFNCGIQRDRNPSSARGIRRKARLPFQRSERFLDWQVSESRCPSQSRTHGGKPSQ